MWRLIIAKAEPVFNNVLINVNNNEITFGLIHRLSTMCRVWRPCVS